MDINKLGKQFGEDGYIVIENFFAEKLMDHLDSIIRQHYGENPDFGHNAEFLERAQTDVIPWFPQNEGVTDFDSIEGDVRLKQLTDVVIGAGWRSQYCMVMFSKQGTSGQAWHQDCPPEEASVYNLNRLVYTSDISDEIGGQPVVIPGSFKRGILPVGDPTADFHDQVVLRPKKGTLILLHGHTWHRVLPVTGAYRFSANFRAAPSGTPDDVTDVCVYRNMRYQFSTFRVVEERV